MTSFEIIALIVSGIGVICFAVIFTILYNSYATSAIGEVEAGQRDVELIEETIYRNAKNEKKLHRVYSKTKQVLSIIAICLLSLFLVFSVISKIQNGVVMIFDRGVIAVATGSMSEQHKDNTYLKSEKLDNQFNAYDVIMLERVKDAADVKKYDVISYVNDKGINVIHRVIDFEYTANGVRYVTRGDANNATDTYKPTFGDVVGRYTGERIALVGLFALFLQSYSGIVTIAAIIYCLIMIDRVGDRINRAENARIEILSSSIEFTRECVIEDGEVESSFVETVRYKDFLYVFDENGFVEKREAAPAAVTTEKNGEVKAEEKPAQEKKSENE
ncbi:MAG: signal peptidase I [Clostridia bacterium]|nr:signal peptidase I [Clostridia bacterium]